MKLGLYSTILAAGIMAAPFAAQAAVFTSTLNFEGAGYYTAEGDGTLNDLNVLTGNQITFGNDPALTNTLTLALPDGTYSLASAAFVTGGSLDLPDVDEPAVWTISIRGSIEGSYLEEGETNAQGYGFNINESITSLELGFDPFSINEASDVLGGPAFLDVNDLTATVLALLGANEFNLLFDDTTALVLTDDISDAPLAMVLSDDDDPIGETVGFLNDLGLNFSLPTLVEADGFFGGTITLSAETRDIVDVAEPATATLLGLGLAGLGVARRRRH